jgi:hypothetical protein
MVSVTVNVLIGVNCVLVPSQTAIISNLRLGTIGIKLRSQEDVTKQVFFPYGLHSTWFWPVPTCNDLLVFLPDVCLPSDNCLQNTDNRLFATMRNFSDDSLKKLWSWIFNFTASEQVSKHSSLVMEAVRMLMLYMYYFTGNLQKQQYNHCW